jgi:hypothetical protein
VLGPLRRLAADPGRLPPAGAWASKRCSADIFIHAFPVVTHASLCFISAAVNIALFASANNRPKLAFEYTGHTACSEYTRRCLSKASLAIRGLFIF